MSYLLKDKPESVLELLLQLATDVEGHKQMIMPLIRYVFVYSMFNIISNTIVRAQKE